MKASEVFRRAMFTVYREESDESPPLIRVLDAETTKVIDVTVLDGELVKEEEDEKDEDEWEDDLEKAISLLKDARDTLDFYADFQLSKGIVLLQDRAEIKKKVGKIDEFLDYTMESTGDAPPDDVSYKTIEIEDDPKPLSEHPTHCPKCGVKNIIDRDSLEAVFCPATNDPVDWKGHYFVGLEPEDEKMTSKERELAERILSNVGIS